MAGPTDSGLGATLCNFLAKFKYENVSPTFVANVIKAGCFARTMWPLIPPAMLLQYIYQVSLPRADVNVYEQT